MAEIIWTKIALKDAEEIHDYIAKDSIYYAQKTIEKFFERIKILHELPNAGRVVPELNNSVIRELIEGNYRIIYTVKKKGISVLRIHHSSRQISKNTKII